MTVLYLSSSLRSRAASKDWDSINSLSFGRRKRTLTVFFAVAPFLYYVGFRASGGNGLVELQRPSTGRYYR